MPMTVVVTRDVPARFRGFLASCMLEVAPGVYTAPRLNPMVRERVWTVLEEWFAATACTGSIVMTWYDPQLRGGQGLLSLGVPPIELHDVDGLVLAARALPDVDAPPDP